jgi:hypothetical protein
MKPLSDGKRDSKLGFTRSPKHIGGFGEGLVIYALIRCGFEVATVDHVGADLIAERFGNRYAISVKSRMYPRGSKEQRGVLFSFGDLEKLEEFSNRFNLAPLFAHVCNDVDEGLIHLVMFPTSRIRQVMAKVKLNYRKHIRDLSVDDGVMHFSWREEQLDECGFDRFE